MKLNYEDLFKKQYKKIKDNNLRIRVTNKIQKLKQNSNLGKPLRYSHKNHWSLRVGKYRIIYRIENDNIFIICFDHRKLIYEEILLMFAEFV
jgi:mRNA-degrading endonuclease RelE of RelBE toxin-antitoxin system